MNNRRSGADRRKSPRRLIDQTCPPQRIWCCPEAQEVLEHHIGNSLLALGVYLKRQDMRRELMSEMDLQLLKGAQVNLNRLQRTRAAIRSCGFAALCPMRRQTFGRLKNFLARAILGKQVRYCGEDSEFR